MVRQCQSLCSGKCSFGFGLLWPIAETGRKTARTFAAQLRLIEEYPEYKFIQSQPAEYEMCRKLYPELLSESRRLSKKDSGLQRMPCGGT